MNEVQIQKALEDARAEIMGLTAVESIPNVIRLVAEDHKISEQVLANRFLKAFGSPMLMIGAAKSIEVAAEEKARKLLDSRKSMYRLSAQDEKLWGTKFEYRGKQYLYACALVGHPQWVGRAVRIDDCEPVKVSVAMLEAVAPQLMGA